MSLCRVPASVPLMDGIRVAKGEEVGDPIGVAFLPNKGIGAYKGGTKRESSGTFVGSVLTANERPDGT